jgi:hypothetical protein
MGSYLANLPNVTLDKGFASSSVITGIDDATALIIMAPSSMTGTATVQVATESDGVTSSATWSDYQSGGSDITIAAGNSTQLTPPVGGSILLVTSATQSGQVYFRVQKRFTVGGA